ncbi:hypothetical protein [Treponema sp. OMZ 855]|uniref:hypothetical protein n=1 Tax=Treponema sp. OMZ 855 TaxID=1643512 RepID=UPI0020A3112B|nr:hypothetical protein [Treponema sp. OMZ 855]UTC50683.1 hypothetical protein E4N65_11745 [Treponema sp. OMZ 855]
MKKLLFLIPGVCALCGAGCAGFSKQPIFTEIIGEEAEPVKIVKTARMENNAVQMFFSGTAEFLSAEIFIPETGETQTCSAERTDIPDDFADSEGQSCKADAYTAFTLTPTTPIGIGAPFVLRGSVSDTKHSVLDFALPFEGANTRPAKLRITEIRPLYSSKPKSEFIEFIVMERGNLSGITITNVGDKQNPHYQFPVAEVSAGETIVYHWRSVEEGIRDETTAKIISGGTQSCPAARDFWGPYTSIPKRNANVILIKAGVNGDIQDAILYCTEKEFAKRGAAPAWNDEALVQAAEAAVASGVWRDGAVLKSAVIAPITASKSLVRDAKAGVNKAGSWTLRDSKQVTMGKPY